ncbi:MAG: penicillin-binding protein 2 [candidate division Zixibacteria bacterium]|nr:penicillin-binding protein 2 [candidate division Zixibacteria bacterium]
MSISQRTRKPHRPKYAYNKLISRRINLVLSVFVIFWAVLVLRNLDIAVIKNEKMTCIASEQQKINLRIKSPRGNIIDRSGESLSWNISSPSVFAVPKDMEHPRDAAVLLANACKISNSMLTKRFENHEKFCWIDRQISFNVKNRIDRLNIDGIYYAYEQKRQYRNRDDWKFLLGAVDIDGNGIGGVEMGFDDILSGDVTNVCINRDARGRKFDAEDGYRSVSSGGCNVVLTIDSGLQDILYTKLKDGVEKYKAVGAYGVFLEVGTSQVLAMAQYYPSGVSSTRNIVISDTYEPGSTFKLVTIASAINSGRISTHDIIDCENGRYKVGRKTITDYKKQGKVTFLKAVELSSNIAMIKVSAELGRETVYRTAVDFGFNSKTGIDLPGEAAGNIHDPDKWSEIEHATVSFGNGLTVTALQIANAYAAVGSGGLLYRPYIHKATLSPQGEIVSENKPVMIRRVISERTAATLLEMLTGVVENGTGIQARIKGLNIAGKTGTSRKIKKNGKGYSLKRYLTSFVGLYPAENPTIVGYIVFDEPTELKTASYTAAPTFREILMKYICSSKMIIDEPQGGKNRDKYVSENHEVKLLQASSSDIYPAKQERVVRTLDELNNALIGKPLRNAIRLIREHGYEIARVDGQGVVKECYPQNNGKGLEYYIKCG